jgi:hypothetical protein
LLCLNLLPDPVAGKLVLQREIRRHRFLIFGLTQPLIFLSIAFDFALVLLNLLLVLLILRLFLTLHVISNERSGTQTQGPADSSASPGMAHGCANNTPRCGAAKGANARSFSLVVMGPPEQAASILTARLSADICSENAFIYCSSLFRFPWVLWISRFGTLQTTARAVPGGIDG